MSKISSKQVKHVAKLANLSLTSDEINTYSKQLSEVLAYMDELTKVDTNNVEPTYQVLDGTQNITREDSVKKSLTQNQALSQATKTHDGYFVTENVFGTKAKSQKPKIKRREKIDKYNAILTEVVRNGTVGHKDLFMTEGIKTTAGSNVLNGYISQYNSTIVTSLEQSGYKTKYKLNQDAWGHGASGENSDFGPTKNPWNEAMVAGGSSSGSGAAVATELVDFATGTDTGGSIRMPASYCNLTAIKPTYGALSRYGVIAFASSLDCPSLIAKTAKELKKYFQVVFSKDKLDATNQNENRAKGKGQRAKVIGIPRKLINMGVDKEVKKATEKAIEVLSKAGYKIKDINLTHAKFGVSVYYIIAPTETSSNLARYDGVRYGNDRTYFGAEAKRRIMLGTFASSVGYSAKYYEKAAKVRTLIVQDYSKTFSEVDAILMPVSPTPAYKIGKLVNSPLKLYMMDMFTIPSSLAGLPSLALPCGFTKENLPIGMQLIGPRWSEDNLFKFGEKYQNLTDWHIKKP